MSQHFCRAFRPEDPGGSVGAEEADHTVNGGDIFFQFRDEGFRSSFSGIALSGEPGLRFFFQLGAAGGAAIISFTSSFISAFFLS